MTPELAGKRIVVVGLGASGAAVATFLDHLDAKVHVTESSTSSVIEERAAALRVQGVEVTTGGHDLDLLDCDLAVLSPGVPPTSEVVRRLRDSGAEVVGEVELAYRFATCDFLAVTGTNGKTTTTGLLARMLVEGGVRAVAAGNIGTPAIEVVTRDPALRAVALEVSSFQLATIDKFRARVGVVLNLGEDHTDWHGSFAEYVAAKARIVENQTEHDVFVPNRSDRHAWAIAETTRARVVPFSATEPVDDGVGPRDTALTWRGAPLLELSEIPLPGAAGVEDVAAAAAAALEYGVAASAVRRAIKAFRPLSHRLEVVAEIDGVTYIDDSKATNPHATLSAVRGLRDVVLIAGGRSKGIDLSPLRETVPPVVAVVALGEAADEVAATFKGSVPVERASSMTEAVRLARSRAVARGSVLLSPACASLDMYSSYAERGEDFARAVRGLIEEG